MRKNTYIPDSKNLDGKQLYYSFLAGAQRIFDNQKLLNKINVFPVADADTGTNLASTMRAIIDTSIPTDNLKTTAVAIADAALIGARGNSGIIFAQFLYGFSNEIKDKNSINTRLFSQITNKAVSYAYESISNPVEGTIITVLREWAEHLDKIYDRFDDFKSLIKDSYQAAKKSLAETTEKLEVLAKANVVDAGAKGFVVFLEGMLDFFIHEEIKKILPARNVVKFQSNEAESISHDDITFRYCTEAMLVGENIDKSNVKELIHGLGNSIVVAGSSSKLRIHIHTNEPSLLFERLNKIGYITFQKVDDMALQQDVVENRNAPIGIMTDSTCDIPADLIKKHQIHVVPLTVHIGNSYYLDGITLDTDRFYKMYETLTERPSTAQPAFKNFSNKLSYLGTHYDSVIGLMITEAMSGTYSNAKKAAKSIGWQMKKNISIINSKTLTSGLGLRVLRLAETIESGKYTHEEIVEKCDEWNDKSAMYVSVTTLKHIIKSGRVSPLKGLIGKTLKLKPIITIKKEDGTSDMLAKSFTEKASTKKLMKYVKNFMSEGELWGYSITHADNKKTALWYKEQLTRLTGQEPKFFAPASPVLGAQVGPGIVAVSIMKR